MVRTPVLTPEQESSSPAEEDPSRQNQAAAPAICPGCGAELAEDQEWCLECGAALTQIHPPPDWRVGLAIMLGVIAVVAIVAALLWP